MRSPGASADAVFHSVHSGRRRSEDVVSIGRGRVWPRVPTFPHYSSVSTRHHDARDPDFVAVEECLEVAVAGAHMVTEDSPTVEGHR